jgi:hypothetical protein
MKFHLLLLVPLALLLTRRWRMLVGFCAAGAMEALLSPLLGGSGGATDYVRLLLAKDLSRLLPSPELTISLQSLRYNFGLEHPAFALVLAVLAVLLTILALREAPRWRFFSATMVGSALAVPHVYGYDASMLLLAVWLILFHSTSLVSRLGALALAAPIVFFCAFLGPPWSAAPSLTLLFLLSSLAWEANRPLEASGAPA